MLTNIKISGFADEIDDSFAKQLEVVNKLGIEYIELRSADGINVSEFTKEKAKEVRNALKEYGIQVSSIGSPIGKIDITADFEPHFDVFQKVVELAQYLETPYIRMFSFFMPKGEDPANYRDEVLYRLKRLIEYAEKNNVILLHENEKDIYGDIACRCEDLMKECFCDHFAAVFDFANFVQCGQDTLKAYEMMKPYIRYVHIKDALSQDGTVVPAGHGDGQVARILEHLDKQGYKGFLSLEPHLTNFTGLKYLEKDAQERASHWDGETAFTLAYESLTKILKEK